MITLRTAPPIFAAVCFALSTQASAQAELPDDVKEAVSTVRSIVQALENGEEILAASKIEGVARGHYVESPLADTPEAVARLLSNCELVGGEVAPFRRAALVQTRWTCRDAKYSVHFYAEAGTDVASITEFEPIPARKRTLPPPPPPAPRVQ